MPCRAGLTDSAFSIKKPEVRLDVIAYQYYRIPIQSREADSFRQEVLAKGNASEKLLINWLKEDRSLAKSGLDSSIAIYDRYMPSVKKTGDSYLLAVLFSLKADALYYTGRYNQAFENYLYAYQQLQKDPEKKYYGATWTLHNIAMNFYFFKDYNKTIEISHQLSKLPSPYGLDEQWFACNNNDLIGMAYFKSNRYDSAAYWFNKTYEAAIASADTAWMGIAKGNLGWLYYKQELYDKAIPLLQTGIAYCHKDSLWDNIAPFSACLAHIYSVKSNFETAGAMLRLSHEANEKIYKPNNRLQYFKVASLYEKAKGNYAKAMEYVDSAGYYETLEAKEFEVSGKTLTESRLAFEKQLIENEVLQEKAEKENLVLYAIVVILFLCVVTAALFMMRQKLRHSLNEEKLRNEKLKAENELSLALFEIKEFSHNISEKNKAIEQLQSEVKTLEEQQTTDAGAKEFSSMVELTALRDEDWADFYIMFDKAFPSLHEKFRRKLPELNENELRYFMLLKIGTQETDIKSMLGTDTQGLQKLRATLVQKLHLTDEEEIAILLESL
ncbi:MAG: tetratricopeptide repeat protein [Ferruginibacter sp.]